MMQNDIDNKPIDSYGNHLEDYQQHEKLKEIVDFSEFRPIGVDSRGVFVFGSVDECQIVNVRLDFEGQYIELLRRDGMFGCDARNHIREITMRYDKWRWIPVKLRK